MRAACPRNSLAVVPAVEVAGEAAFVPKPPTLEGPNRRFRSALLGR